MKKLLLSLASTAMLAGFGAAAHAGNPTALTAAAMDGITAGGGGQSSCDRNYSRHDSGKRTSQENNSFLSPQVNVAENTNVSPNVSVINVGENNQETNTHQSNSQSNFNGNIAH